MVTAEGARALPRKRRSRLLRSLVAAVAFAVGLVSILFVTVPAAAQSPTVSIVDFGFAPASVQATMVGPEPGFPQAHAHVGFVNNGGVQHTVTFDDGRIPSSPTLNPNQSFDAVITVTGSFSYHCSIHPSMQGSITVAPVPAQTTTTTTEPPTTAVPTTTPPVTAAATTTTTTTARPGPAVAAATTRPLAAAVTTTTTAPPTTPVPSSAATAEATTVPTTGAPSTTTTADASSQVDATAREPAPGGARWPLVLLLVVLLVGAVFLGRMVRVRRRSSPREP